jgi:asparagine synthetase B (glutamine-hydrolysing)
MLNGVIEAAARREVVIAGLPVYSGELLTSHTPVFESLKTPPDYIRFAEQLRGQFSIIVERVDETFAITDFGCSRPVFYAWDTARSAYRVAPRLADVSGLSTGRFNSAALFFHAVRGGIGIEPFYENVKEVFPATVAHFRGAQVESASYLDWGRLLETRPIGPDEAEAEFVRIASEYLAAVLKGRRQAACLLSGGTDSALMAWLLRNIGKDVLCLTADYPWKRYSEFAEASRIAADLGLKQERVMVPRRDFYAAFRILNSSVQNAPCGHSQSPSLYWLGRRAGELGLDRMITGDHADALFLGFDRFFRGLPAISRDYESAVAAMLPEEALDRLYALPTASAADEELLSVFGVSPRECLEWQKSVYAQDRQAMAGWAKSTPLPVLQQLDGQIWAGIPWQNIFLAPTQALSSQAEFVSPFYDIEMVKFALSLPTEFKFSDGATKALLRSTLHRALKRTIVKRASPNPSRVWSLFPNLQLRRAMTPRFRPLYTRLWLRNFRRRGHLSGSLDKAAALGIWLASQSLRW